MVVSIYVYRTPGIIHDKVSYATTTATKYSSFYTAPCIKFRCEIFSAASLKSLKAEKVHPPIKSKVCT